MNRLEQLKQIIRNELAPPRDITPETTLEDLGLDSLEFVALMQAIAHELGREIPEEKWKGIESVQDILNALVEEPC